MAVHVNLGPVLEKYVVGLVEQGRYSSETEVLKEAVRLVQEKEQAMIAMETSIEAGLEDIRHGRTVAADEVFDRLEWKYSAKAQKRRA